LVCDVSLSLQSCEVSDDVTTVPGRQTRLGFLSQKSLEKARESKVVVQRSWSPELPLLTPRGKMEEKRQSKKQCWKENIRELKIRFRGQGSPGGDVRIYLSARTYSCEHE